MKKRGQIWVETMIYILIGFALIGLVLAFAKPKIDELRDKAIIEQSIDMMEDIDITLTEVIKAGPGNKRVIETVIRKGNLKIDGLNNEIMFEFEGEYIYSEPGEPISQGNLIIETRQLGERGIVNVTRIYSNYDITYNGGQTEKIISKAKAPYKLVISNLGNNLNGDLQIDISLN